MSETKTEETRKVLRCPVCQMVQYVTLNGRCRKPSCKAEMEPQERAAERAAVTGVCTPAVAAANELPAEEIVEKLVLRRAKSMAEAMIRAANGCDLDLAERLGEVIRNLREWRGKSVKEVADLTNISISQIAGIELGQRVPKVQTLICFAVALNVPVTYFLLEKAEQEAMLGERRPEEIDRDAKRRKYFKKAVV